MTLHWLDPGPLIGIWSKDGQAGLASEEKREAAEVGVRRMGSSALFNGLCMVLQEPDDVR